MLENVTSYYNDIRGRCCDLDPREKLEILRFEMLHHIDCLRQFTDLLKTVDNSLWQGFMPESLDYINKFPEKLDSTEDFLAEEYVNDELSPCQKLEVLCYYLPVLHINFLLLSVQIFRESVAKRGLSGLPKESEHWFSGIRETIYKMSVLTLAVMGKRW